MTNFAIKNNAMDYVRYVSINDSRATKSYQTWLEASREVPCQGLHLMKMAEWSRLNQIIRDLEYQSIDVKEYTCKAKALIRNIFNRTIDKDTIDLARSVKEKYPQTYAKRLAIISECEDDFWGKVKVASNKKTPKKFYTSLFKLLIK